MSKAKFITASVFTLAAAVGLSACSDERGAFKKAPEAEVNKPVTPRSTTVEVAFEDAYCTVTKPGKDAQNGRIAIIDRATGSTITLSTNVSAPFNSKTGTLDQYRLDGATMGGTIYLTANLKEGTCHYARSGLHMGNNNYKYKIQPN